MTTDTSATERAQQAASTAADEGKHVASTAAGEAKQVAGQAADQAKNVINDALSQATTQAQEQARAQRDRLVSTLATLGDDLEGMAEQAPAGLATDLTRQAADRVRSVGTHLDGRDPGDLVEDVRRFARRRPGTFLLGALATGVVAGRLLRGASDGIAGAAAVQPSTPGTTGTTGTTGTSGSIGGTPSTPAATGVTPPVVGGTTPPAGAPTTNPPMPSTQPGHVTQPPRSTLEGDESGYSGGGLSAGDRL